MKEERKLKKVLKGYRLVRELGEGSWATVYEAVRESDKTIVAVKEIDKSHLEKSGKLSQLLRTEIKVLKECHNDNVISFVESFQTKKAICIVMEYCNGGDLEALLKKKKNIVQDEALGYLKQILNGFKGLHQIGAMHRDFKAANILFHDGICKIADLGFAKQMRLSQLEKGRNMAHTVLGTSLTMAPEVLQEKPYTFSADIWSIGVVYYQMLYGKMPYKGNTDYEIFNNIKTKTIDFSQFNISPQSIDFIKRCLTIDPAKRINWTEIYEHELMQKNKRVMVYGTLRSKFSVNQNRTFYENQSLKENTNLSEEENKDNAVLEETVNFNEQQEKEEQKKSLTLFNDAQQKLQMETKFFEHERIYLSARNKAMFVFKFVNPHFEHYSRVKANHSTAMFILSKKAYLDLKALRYNIIGEKNIFNLAYFKEFLVSPVYKDIQKMVDNDVKFVQEQSEMHKRNISIISKQIESEYDLDNTVSKDFNKLVRDIVSQYWYRLAEGMGSVRQHRKQYLIRSLEALSYYNKGRIDSEEFDRMMTVLDFSKAEAEQSRKLQKMVDNMK